jgi:hypothetical protein
MSASSPSGPAVRGSRCWPCVARRKRRKRSRPPIRKNSSRKITFTEDHYRGFPAVLVRLDKIPEKELRALLTAAWRCQAPRALVKAMIAKRRSTLRAAN